VSKVEVILPGFLYLGFLYLGLASKSTIASGAFLLLFMRSNPLS
jgi:hypothetical protein